jgi:type I restriction enzyme, S subunit
MLSVYRDHGVVRKGSRIDNFNKTADNRNIYQLVDVGWLIVNRMKAWQGSLGISSYRGIVSGHYLCFRPDHAQDPRFLDYLLRSSPYIAELRLLSRGVRPNQIEIDNDWLRVLPVRLPQLGTQRAIANFLDRETERIDALIMHKRRMIELLEERKTGTMLAAASGCLSCPGSWAPSSLPWLEARPSHWPEVLIRLVASTGSGHTPSRDRPDWWEDGTIPWITTGEVAQVRSDEQEVIYETREKISQVGLANSAAALHPPGTVVLCRTASAGYSGIMGTQMATSQDFATWTCGPKVRPRYLLLCLRAMRPDLLGRLATGSTHKTIYMPDIQSLRIPLPSLDEQDAATEAAWRHLRPLFAATRKLREQIILLQEHRHALITAVVTGESAVAGAAA